MLAALLVTGCAAAQNASDLISQHTACPTQVNYIQAAWSPDAARIVVIAQRTQVGASSSFDLISMTGEGRQPVALAANKDSLSWVAWTPGPIILFSTAQVLYTVKPDGSGLRRLPIDSIQSASWLPDGKHFVYTRVSDASGLSIGMAGADGFNEVDLGHGDAPIPSPDGRRLLFTTYDRAGRPQVNVEDADGTHAVQLTADPDNNGPADWSPDGTKIAFTSNRAGPTSDIYLMDADPGGTGSGGHVTRLTTTGHVTSMPAWSPSGDRIAFISDAGGASDIYTIRVDGSGLTRLTANPGAGFCPH